MSFAVFILITLLSPVLWAQDPDPWLRPKHFRAVQQPIESWRDLKDKKTRYRFWWDDSKHPVEIQWRSPKGWKTLSTKAKPGYISKKLPRRTRFRSRFTNRSKRWGAMIYSQSWVSPTDWSRLYNQDTNSPALLSGNINQIKLAKDAVWVANAGGGLATFDHNGQLLRRWTRWEGLPDDQVIALSTHGKRTLVGTANGAVLLKQEKPVKSWRQELPDPYTQAVYLNQEDMWIGTFRGLRRIRSGYVQSLLGKWSVFSLAPAKKQGMWVGYEGLTHLDPQDKTSQLDWTGNVYAIIDTGPYRYIASQKQGVLRLDGKESKRIHPAKASGLALGKDGLWIAGGKDGLIDPQGKSHGKEQGLTSNNIQAVARDDNNLWVGSTQGLSRIAIDAQGQWGKVKQALISPFPSHWRVSDVLATNKGVFFAANHGAWHLGKPHRYPKQFERAKIANIRRWLAIDKNIWAIAQYELAVLHPDGTMKRHAVPDQVVTADNLKQQIWFATPRGIWKLSPQKAKPQLLHEIHGVKQLRQGVMGFWAVDSKGQLLRIGFRKITPYPKVKQAISVAPDKNAVCVGTEDGLLRVWPGKKRPIEDVMGSDDKNVAITAVAGDGNNGCYYAGEDGSVGLATADDFTTLWNLPPDSSKIHRLVPFGKWLWVLTEHGAWLMWAKGDR